MVKCEECKCLKDGRCTLYSGSQVIKKQWGGCWLGAKIDGGADVVEAKHGEWVHTDKAAHWHSKDECSECHYHAFHRIDLTHFNYCPNCGAKMDGEKR